MILLAAGALLAAAPARDAGVPRGSGKVLATVSLDEPRGGWSAERMLRVKGHVSDPTVQPVVVSINGDHYLLRTVRGDFERKFPAAAGKNVVTVLATNQAGTAKAQATSYAQVPTVPLMAVLSSDSEGVSIDMHVYEPTAAALHDGVLDFSAMAHVEAGYAPYLYVHRAPPRGVFIITTNYWPSGDQAPTVATLSLTLFEGSAQELRRRVQVPLSTPGTPRVLAFVNVLAEGRALVYVPGQDVVPEPGVWPKNLAAVAARAVKSGGTSAGPGGGSNGGGD